MLSSFLGANLLTGLSSGAAHTGSAMLGFLWYALALVLVILSLALILVILIQDPKGGGLASAFGAGPGGDSILGAQATRDISRITTILSVAVAVVVIVMVWLGHWDQGISNTLDSGAPATLVPDVPPGEGGATPPPSGSSIPTVPPPPTGGAGSTAPTPIVPPAVPETGTETPPAPSGTAQTETGPAPTENAPAPTPPAPAPGDN